MQLPIGDARLEDGRKQPILPHPGVEGPNQRLDHHLVDSGFPLRPGDDRGAPVVCAAKFMRDSPLSTNHSRRREVLV